MARDRGVTGGGASLVVRCAVAVGAGGSAGVLAKLADESGVRGLTDLTSQLALWVVVTALIARAARGPAAAALVTASFFVPLCVAYYAWTVLVLGYGLGPLVLAWLVVGGLVAPAVAAAGRWARDAGGVVGAVVVGFMAGAVFAGGATSRMLLLLAGWDVRATRPVQMVVEALASIVVVILLARSARMYIVALAVLVPGAVVADRLAGALAAAGFGF